MTNTVVVLRQQRSRTGHEASYGVFEGEYKGEHRSASLATACHSDEAGRGAIVQSFFWPALTASVTQSPEDGMRDAPRARFFDRAIGDDCLRAAGFRISLCADPTVSQSRSRARACAAVLVVGGVSAACRAQQQQHASGGEQTPAAMPASRS